MTATSTPEPVAELVAPKAVAYRVKWKGASSWLIYDPRSHANNQDILSAADEVEPLYSADALASTQARLDELSDDVLRIHHEKCDHMDARIAAEIERDAATAALDEAKRLAASARSLALEEAAVLAGAKAAYAVDWPKDDWDRLGPGYHQDRYKAMSRACLAAALASQGSAEDPRPGETEPEERV